MINEPENHIRQLITLDLSKLQVYCIGLVVEDNLENEPNIKIYPVEKLFNLGGDLKKEDEWVAKKIKERKVAYSNEHIPKEVDSLEDISINRTKYLNVEWITKNNQITPPNVCKGEYVIVYRYSNRDEYYWEEEFTNLTLRKEEHVVYTYSDKPNLDDAEDEIEDRYTITISPKNKEISIHTTDKYGELTTYDITLKTDDGYLEILDGHGNFIKLDSAKDDLTADVKHDINIKAGNDINAEAGNDITVMAGNDINAEAGNNANVKAGMNIKAEAGGSVDIKAGASMMLNAPNMTIDCANLVVTGATEFSGPTVTHLGIPIDSTHMHDGNLGFKTSTPTT